MQPELNVYFFLRAFVVIMAELLLFSFIAVIYTESVKDTVDPIEENPAFQLFYAFNPDVLLGSDFLTYAMLFVAFVTVCATIGFTYLLHYIRFRQLTFEAIKKDWLFLGIVIATATLFFGCVFLEFTLVASRIGAIQQADNFRAEIFEGLGVTAPQGNPVREALAPIIAIITVLANVALGWLSSSMLHYYQRANDVRQF